ncbi:MAG: 30S ribosomal protein S17 [Candidatus Omnitrophica bacterium]|nr:30S ribosomal protein S17 [Candidatus Omnitrophota bacterium]
MKMGKKKEFVGEVISDKMQKTVIVKSAHLAKHPKYARIIKRYNKFKAHDENGLAKMGDIVRIAETRPLSKDKRFRVVEIIKKAKTSVELKEDIQ